MRLASRFTLPTAAVAALAVVVGVAAATAQQDLGGEPSCTLQAGPTRSVVRVIDAETVLLDDHQEVRLIGALAPRSPDLSPSAQPWPPEDAAIAALRALVLGRSISLATSGRARDRYGRRLAHLFVERDGERMWVQGEMLAAGHARVYGLPGSYACMRELLAHEVVAREAGSGLWASAAYAVRSARRSRELMRRRNSYEIVAGNIVKVAMTKARTYINFGRDWRRDFTAGIEARVLRAHPEWAKQLAALEGKRVEVRGWIQYRNGPYIDIEDPSQIAPVDERLPGRSPPSSGAMTSSDRDMPPPPEKEQRLAPRVPGAVDL
ncbi:MAG: thermonuclease family protein [Hyphomicrobium sp.]|uniref:thermonuclease family protein n=1 Tax=Hyphomicrobium sp. TaxID=82 RepID=UPI001326D587|nr:thermonuclease family protein [Hyphomicrobium sp.]KAB2943923.1 MAG: thermonuclease family protein [Hyphomicrobium sp.]MBZ0208829.1 thermonuclease family protein [Hyphomicrobium sp.]